MLGNTILTLGTEVLSLSSGGGSGPGLTDNADMPAVRAAALLSASVAMTAWLLPFLGLHLRHFSNPWRSVSISCVS